MVQTTEARMIPTETCQPLPWKIGLPLISMVTALALITGGVFFYQHEKESISARKIDQIRYVAANKIGQITAWRDQLMREAEHHGADPFLWQNVRELLLHPSDQALRESVRRYLKMIQSEEGLLDIILIYAGGHFLLSASGQQPAEPDQQMVELAHQVLVSEQPVVTEFTPCQSCPELAVDVAAALEGADRKPLAVLLLRTDVRQSLYPLLESWPLPSATSAETFLVRRDGDSVLILSPPQQQSSPHLGERIPLTQTGLPAVQAALGVTGLFFGRDFRGVEVIADLQPVPGTTWVMVATIDQDEILAEAREHGWFIAGLTILSLLMTATSAAFLFHSRQRRMFRSLYLAEQEKRLADKALVESAQRLEKLNRVYLVLNAVNQAIIRKRKPEELFAEACRIAVEEGGFRMAWVGVMDQGTTSVRPVAQSGFASEYLEQLGIDLDDPSRGRGPTATAFRCGEAVVVNDIGMDPQMAPWREKAAQLGYQSSAALPLVVAGQVVATLNLYSAAPDAFDQDEMRLLDEMVGDMAFALEFMAQEEKRQTAESELRKLTRAMEQSSVAMMITNTKGDLEYVNPKFLNVTGYALEEVLGHNPRLLKSGETSAAEYRALWHTITKGGDWHGEFHNRKKDGTLFWERAVISPIFNAEGQITNYLAVKEDITKQKALEDQLVQSQKMETVGRLAGGVAHDFNNMLGVILGCVDLALDWVQADDPMRLDLEEIRKAAERSALLTRQLLAFARKQIICPQILDLNNTIDNGLSMLRRLLGEDIALVWNPAPGLWPVKIDPSQVDQILANITVNARDALTGNGVLAIETANVVVDTVYCQDHPECRPGDYVMMVIRDNGKGMDQATLARIFEPFFTTKGLGQGTGLGLATIYGIVKQNKGSIIASSELGVGTTFRIYLPRVEEGTVARPDVISEVSSQGATLGGETVLLVEDEAAILELIARILRSNGFTVLAAGSPSQALQLAVSHPGPLHLLITDLVMPEMSGKELAEQLTALRPETKVLFMSGYTAEVMARHGVLENTLGFIGKPFAKNDLLSKVRQLLES